jgi:hypothetical protein
MAIAVILKMWRSILVYFFSLLTCKFLGQRGGLFSVNYKIFTKECYDKAVLIQ